MKTNAYGEPMLRCPDCGSERVAVTEETMVMVNTGGHWCHSVKMHDAEANALCLDCQWTGHRGALAQGDKP